MEGEEMEQKIYIVNGMAGAGKDTFYEYLYKLKLTRVTKTSSIEPFKRVALMLGWDGYKDEKSRKFLSDLKMLSSEFNDASMKWIEKKIEEFRKSELLFDVLLIDIREPKEIKRVKQRFGAEAILIKNDNVKQITSNDGDAGVYDYDGYDHIIENNGSLEEYYLNIRRFAISEGLCEDLI